MKDNRANLVQLGKMLTQQMYKQQPNILDCHYDPRKNTASTIVKP